jgi:N-acetylglucosamine-6-phosphate deacetylase
VVLDGERISTVDVGVDAAVGDDVYRDATLVPGLIDLQVNGADGASYDDPDPAARRRATDYHLRRGTTSLLPTLISAPLEALVPALARLAADVRAQRELAGIHLEGPFLAEGRAGAHARSALCDASSQAVERLLEAADGQLRMLTLAPEREGALDAVERLTRGGVICAAGHSQASRAQVGDAIARGLSFVTHVGNASSWPTRVFDPDVGYRRSEPGLVGAFMLDRRLRAGLILDGHHLDPQLARALVELRGASAVALVSDASPFAGLAPGEYRLWGMHARVHEGGFATSGEGLAGSTITLADALRVAVTRAEIPLERAVQMAARTPAEVLGLAERKGSLAAGFDADLLLLDASLHPIAVYRAGKSL